MNVLKNQDAVIGSILALFGIIVSLYSLNNYNIGTVQRMGPGMFPMALGVFIAGLGGLLSLLAVLKQVQTEETKEEVQWRVAPFVLVGVALFSLLITTVGLFPAVISVVAVSAFADGRANIVTVSILCAVLCLLAYLIFSVALGLHFSLLKWPF